MDIYDPELTDWPPGEGDSTIFAFSAENLKIVRTLARFARMPVIAKKAGAQSKLLKDAILPLIGFAFCALIWWNLNNLAKTVGGLWFAVGIIYVGFKTNWFRSAPVMIDFRES